MTTESANKSAALNKELGYKIVKQTLLLFGGLGGGSIAIYWIFLGLAKAFVIVDQWLVATILSHKDQVLPILDSLIDLKTQLLLLAGLIIFSMVRRLKNLVSFYAHMVGSDPLDEKGVKSAVRSLRIVVSANTPYGLGWWLLGLNCILARVDAIVASSPEITDAGFFMVVGGAIAVLIGLFSYEQMTGETMEWILPAEVKEAYGPVNTEKMGVIYFRALKGYNFPRRNDSTELGYMAWMVYLLAQRHLNHSEERELIQNELKRVFEKWNLKQAFSLTRPKPSF